MADDLHEIWRDDRLIEAAARGDLQHLDDVHDPAAGPLCALAGVADARPLPRLDVDPAVLLDNRRHHRYAVRSLAVAVTAVATLSTSGVAAVVTGDPLRPAKAVWHQIQDQTTTARAHAVGDSAESDAAVGAPADAPAGAATAPAGTATLWQPGHAPSGPAGTQGQTARAPVAAERADTSEPGPRPEEAAERARPSGPADAGDDSETEDRREARQAYAEQRADRSEQTEPEQDSGQQQDEQDGDDAGSQPAPQDDPQPAPGEEPDGDLDPLVLPGDPEDGEQQGARPAPLTQDPRTEDGATEEQQPLTEPTGDGSTELSDGSAQDLQR
jgi:hypothetical protein